MNKIGKNFKFINKDLGRFIKDPIRELLCNQDENFISSLKSNITITSNQETIVGQKIVGTMDLNVPASVRGNMPNPLSVDINEDINFSVDKHYENLKELQLENATTDTGAYFKYESSFKYNFLIKKYEDYINNGQQNINDLNLPNFYQTIVSNLNSNLNLDFNAFDYLTKQIFLDNLKNNINNNSNNINIYNSFVDFNGSKVRINNYFKIINAYKQQFPFYNQITFNTHLKETENFSSLFQANEIYTNIFQDFNTNKTLVDFNVTDNSSNTRIRKIQYSGFDKINLNNNLTIIDQINTLISKKNRKLSDIYNGKHSYVEVVGYVLEKYNLLNLSDNKLIPSDAPLQQWYIPNLSDDYIQIIDSQIKYNKNYAFRLNAMALVIGNKYKYIDIKPTSTNSIKIIYEIEPLLNLYFIDNSAEYINKLLSNPPLPPDMDITPLMESENVLKMNFNNAIGSNLKKPYPLSIEETAYYEDLRKAQLRPDDKIFFKSDELITKIQVFRIDKKPRSYNDFKISDIVNESNLEDNNLSSYSIIDTIETGIEYFYTCRSLDYHDGISYFTPIYKIKSIDGVITSEIFDPEIKTVDKTRNFKKYLKISPALGQLVVKSASQTNVDMGVNKDSLINKNFKIRVTSRQTNRKFDINLKFILDINIKTN